MMMKVVLVVMVEVVVMAELTDSFTVHRRRRDRPDRRALRPRHFHPGRTCRPVFGTACPTCSGDRNPGRRPLQYPNQIFSFISFSSDRSSFVLQQKYFSQSSRFLSITLLCFFINYETTGRN